MLDVEIHKIPALRSPVMLIAFSGWNDAAEAATGTTSHILGAWTDQIHAIDEHTGVVPELIADVDPEEFYDFQVNRPMVEIDDSLIRSLTWPGTQVFGLQMPDFEFDFVIVQGVEPSMKWKTFTQENCELRNEPDPSNLIVHTNFYGGAGDPPHLCCIDP